LALPRGGSHRRAESAEPGRGFRYSVRGVFGADASREWSAIRKVALFTVTILWQRGQAGSIGT